MEPILDQIVEIISKYRIEAVIIALMINLFTGIIKLPIKALSKKLENYTQVTRFIVFFPAILGFILTFLYEKYIQGAFIFDRQFITLWITSSSLSMTFYAFFEKIFMAQKETISKSEIKTYEAILENIQIVVNKIFSSSNDLENIPKTDVNDNGDNEPRIEDKAENRKIVLKGNKNEEIKFDAQ